MFQTKGCHGAPGMALVITPGHALPGRKDLLLEVVLIVFPV